MAIDTNNFVGKLITQKYTHLCVVPCSFAKNVINAVNSAKEKGMFVIGLTGKSGGKMADLVDLEIRTPMSEWADRVQEIHIKIIHSLIHYIESNL